MKQESFALNVQKYEPVFTKVTEIQAPKYYLRLTWKIG